MFFLCFFLLLSFKWPCTRPRRRRAAGMQPRPADACSLQIRQQIGRGARIRTAGSDPAAPITATKLVTEPDSESIHILSFATAQASDPF